MAKSNRKSGIDRSYTSQDILRLIPNESVNWRLQSPDGAYFGDVSYDAYKAVEGGTLDSYKPKSKKESEILANFRKHPGISVTLDGIDFGYVSYDAYNRMTGDDFDGFEGYKPHSPTEEGTIKALMPYLENKAKDARVNSNPAYARYNIDPADFDEAALKTWGKEHHHEWQYADPYAAVGWDFLSNDGATKQEIADAQVLKALATNNQRQIDAGKDLGASWAALIGIADGLTFGGMSYVEGVKAKRDYEQAGLNPDAYVSPAQAWAKTTSDHNIAYGVGYIGGSTITTIGVGSAVSAATKSVSWLANASPWVKSAVDSGITFAISEGAGTAFQGGDFGDVMKSAGIGFVGGAAGGAVSAKVSEVTTKLLNNKAFTSKVSSLTFGLVSESAIRNSILSEGIRSGIVGASFAAGKTAATYYLYPEGSRPTAEAMKRDIGTAFAFASISSFVSSMKASAQSKKYLNDLNKKMSEDYASMVKASSTIESEALKGDGFNVNIKTNVTNLAENVIAYADAMEGYLSGKGVRVKVVEYAPGTELPPHSAKSGSAPVTKTITVGEGARFIGQSKYVKAMVGELRTIRANANAVLNSAGTPSTSSSATVPPALTSTPAIASLSASGGAPAISPTVSTAVAPAGATAVPTVADATVAVTPLPTEAAVTNAAVSTKVSGELGEVMGAGEITKFTPESANGEIKRLENILIAKGADDVSRQEIIGAALEIEKALAGSDKTIRSVFNNVSKITSGAVTEIKNKAGVSSAYWKLFGENFKAIPSGNVTDNVELITEYATAYTEALKNGNPEKYNAVVVSADGKDLSAELPRTIMQNVIPSDVQDAGAYRLVATQIKNIIVDVGGQLESERAEIYGNDAGQINEVNIEPVADTTAPVTEAIKEVPTLVSDSEQGLKLTDKAEINKTTRTGSGKEAWTIKLAEKLPPQQHGELIKAIEAEGGTYAFIDGVNIGFLFDAEPSENVIRTINSFFETGVDATPSVVNSLKGRMSSEPVKAIPETKANDTEPTGRILSLKKAENIYSAFEGAEKIYVGRDIITDKKIAIPYTEEALSRIKEVSRAEIIVNENISIEYIYRKDNNIVIEGDPKISGDMYVFDIDGEYYATRQKHIDAVNDGDNIITAGNSPKIPWTVHNSNRNLVAIIMPVSPKEMTAEKFSNLPSVSEVVGKAIGLSDTTENEGSAEEVVNVSYSLEDEDSDLQKISDGDTIRMKKGEKWHPNLSKQELNELYRIIDRDVHTSTNNITDMANWKMTRINGKSVFAIYSTENLDNPTLLYESKGNQAVLEQNILLDLLEDEENGKGINRKSNFAQRVSEGSWMQNVINSQNNLRHMGSGRNNQNVGVLQRQPQSHGSPAFRNVLENLFSAQEGNTENRKSITGTRASDVEYLELAKNPEKNEARLRELVDDAAKAEGYNYKGYHGTGDVFYEFSKNKRGNNTGAPSSKKAFFFVDNQNVAKGYAEDARPEKINELYKKAERLENQAFYNGKYAEAEKAWEEYEAAELEYKGTGVVVPAYLGMKNPLIYDFKGSEYREVTYNNLIQEALKNGNDGLIFKNTYDGSNKTHDDLCTVYALFDSNQVKSADLVTYDDDGNIIPLSERFDTSKNDIRYSIEGENINEQRGDILSDDGGKRQNSTSARKQIKTMDGRSSRYRERRSTAYQRRKLCQTLRTAGNTETKVIHGHKCEVIPSQYYDKRMQKLVDKNKADGFEETVLITGQAKLPFVKNKNGNSKTARGVFIETASGKKIAIIQYDNEHYMPEQIIDHEKVHKDFKSKRTQKVKNLILNSLSVREKKDVLNRLSKDYDGVIEGNEDAIFEEFVANVLSGMNEYTIQFNDVVKAYWAGDDASIDGFRVSEYAESIDAGGHAGKLDKESVESIDLSSTTEPLEFDFYVKKIRMKVFPPFDETAGSDAHERAERWAKDDSVEVGCRKLASYREHWFIIEKFESLDYGYQIMGAVRSKEVRDFVNEVKRREYEADKTRERAFDGLAGGTETGRSDGLRGYSDDSDTDQHLGKAGGSDELVANESRGQQISVNAERVVEQDSSDKPNVKYSLADDGEYDLMDIWDEKIKEYGAIPKGEKPARDIEVPKKISKTEVVSRFARTMLEAGVTPDDAVSEFERRILDGEMTHEVITNENAGKWAKSRIEYLGFEEALNEWDVLSRSGKIGKKELALGMELYNQCITNKDVKNAMKIAAELAAEATRAGQTLQACRMLKEMSPDGQLYFLEKSIQKMNEEFRDKLGDRFKDIELDEQLMERFFTESDSELRDKIYDEICQDIADQIPATLRDKWNSWRYLAMLGNPRTHIRNLTGNAVFVPAVRIKNYIGAVIESAARIDTAERTKSLWKTKEAISFAEKDFKAMAKILQGENAKYAVTGDIEGKRTIFSWKWLEKLRRKNFDYLEKGDMWFLHLHYVDALARIITVRKLDVNNIDTKTLDAIRALAVKEAQEATYRDANALADALNKMQRSAERSKNKGVRAAGVLLEGVMPYKKTPLNIAKQGINYSPYGILKGIYKAAKKLTNGKAYSATDVINDLSKGLTGTGFMLLGMLLASLGILVSGDEENKKKREFNKMVGEQSYALKIGGKSYSIDWMTPSCLPLFVGAELHELTKDDISFADVTSALSTLVEPLLELSVFSGVSGVIESAQYSETNAIFAVMSDMFTSYLAQGLPTIGGQLSRIIDPVKREYYYTDKNSNVPQGIQRFIGQAASKIPFASYLFEPSVDEWGRVETYGGLGERIFENVLSPGYYSEDNYTAVDKELKELYERTGESSVLPTIQQKYYVADKAYYHMSPEDYTEVKKVRGQKSFEKVKALIESPDYAKMTDEEKVNAIEKCYKEAGKETKEIMLDKVKSRK